MTLQRHGRRGLFFRMAPVVPEGQVGQARTEHFTITGKEFLGFRRDDYITPGDYVRLILNGGTWMSDTDMEQRTNITPILKAQTLAQGNVLVAGLGIGLMVLPVLKLAGVRKVTVVERSSDVIDLVAQPLADAAGPDAWKLKIVEADIFDWTPNGERFDLIWFDIWRDVCTDNLAQVATLHQRFKGKKRAGGWMGSWRADDLRYLRRQEQRAGW